jgi:acyl-CoA thioesterase-1
MSNSLQNRSAALPPSRRDLIAGGGALLMSAAVPDLGAAADRPKVVTMLGDSITAGFGLPLASALPTQLQAALAALGQTVRVRGAGVSGDTSADGLARADFSVAADTDLCVVALGANDLLQGIDPKVTRVNLEQILAKLKARHIPALLVGLQAPHAIGAGYAHDFDAVFPAVAKAAGAAFYPNLLAGVILNPALNQADGIHPNAQGARIIAGRLAPVVAAALRSRR